MKSTRFQILAATFVAMIAAGMFTQNITSNVPQDFVKNYGMNAVDISAAVQKCPQRTQSNAKFIEGTGGYVAANIGLGGQHVDLVTVGLKREKGVTDIGDRFNAGETIIFDRIVIEHGTNANDDVKAVDNWSTDLPQLLRSSELKIKSNDKVIWSGLLNSIHREQNGEKGYYQLIDPRGFADDKDYQITVMMPGQFTDSDKHFLRVQLEGLRTYISS